MERVRAFQRVYGDTPEERFRLLQVELEEVFGALNEVSPYGELWCEDNSTVTALPASGWVDVEVLNKAGAAVDVGQDKTISQFRIQKTGLYEVHFHTSCTTSTNNEEIEFSAHCKGERHKNLHTERKIATAGDIGSCGFHGRVRLLEGELLKVQSQSLTGATNLTVKDANFMIRWVGP